jgi:pumilio RNA-binding family
VVEFCQDQNGSRFIQQRLEVGNVGEKEVVMAEVLPAVRRLRNDVFGNYVVQKLFDFGTPRMKGDLRETLQGEMLQLSFQMYGYVQSDRMCLIVRFRHRLLTNWLYFIYSCRVVQKALESLDETDLPRLLMEFHNNVLSCIHDQNGNHVIQKCIEVMSKKSKKAREDGDAAGADFFSEQIDFIIDDILGNVASLSCHPYGCRVLQRILEHCVEPKKSRALDEISLVHKTLLDDQYGNYVIQHVLQFGRHSDRDSILKIVAENGLLLLSRQKFASNVVEKLLKYGTAQQRRTVVREMLKVSQFGIVVFPCPPWWTRHHPSNIFHSFVGR